MMRRFCYIALPLLLLNAGIVSVAAGPMSMKQVIGTVLAQRPELQVSRVDTAIAAIDAARIESLLDPVVTANVGVSDEKTPTVSDFQPAENRLARISGAISKPLSGGDTVGVDFSYVRTSQGFNSPFAAQLARFNPAYSNQININYRRPLLKGAGRPDYSQGVLRAQAGILQAERQRQVVAHNLALQAVNAYYQLASDDINVDIARQAVQRARKLLAYQRSREQFGLIEAADRLQAEALLAARKTDLQRALSRRLNDQNRLNRLMLRSGGDPIELRRDTHALPTPVGDIDAAVARAARSRPELQALDAQLQAADAQLKIARNQEQPQLDVVATLGSRALKRTPLPAAAAGLSAHDHFASLSLEFSDALGRGIARAAIRKAELQRQRIQAERERIMAQIRDDIAAARMAIAAARPTLAAARAQVRAERRKFHAEMQRYRQGRSDTATLVQFEGELRNAALNAELQQLTIELAETQLAWAEGRLLDALGLNESADSESRP